MIRRIAVTMALLSCAGFPALEASAQPRDSGSSRDRLELVDRIQQRFRNRIARELQLDDEQREWLGEVFSAYARSRAELLPRRRELEREIAEHLDDGGTSEEDAMNLIEEMRALRQREAELRLEEEDRLLEALSPSQVLRLQSLRDQFGNQIRRLRGDDGPGGPRRQGGGGRR